MKKVYLVVGFVLVLLVADRTIAQAATYTNNCPGADASCIALAERLEATVLASENVLAAVQDVETAVAAGSGPVSGTVALASDDRDRLDLAWWGMWALVGIMLAGLFAQKWHNSWRFTRE